MLEHDALGWDVAIPQRPGRVPGVTMAGFRDRGVAPLGHRLVPHSGVTILLDFGAGPTSVTDALGRQHRGSLVAGLGLGGAAWGRGENAECLQVRLSPVIAGALLGSRLADLDDGVVTLRDLWGPEVSRIGEQLHDAASWEDRFALTDALLAGRHASGPPVEPEVAWAWRRIMMCGGMVRVEQLAVELGWSRKRLWSRFQAQIGLSPKRSARLIRFDRAAHRLVAGDDAARVAAHGGYADQSHLHRDVVAFAGVTPVTAAAEPFLTVDDTAWPHTRVPPHAGRQGAVGSVRHAFA